MWECGKGFHYQRCPNEEGKRYPDNGRSIKLRVEQVRPGNDWRPNNLAALCLRCLRSVNEVYNEREVREHEPTLFPVERITANDGPRERN